MQNFQAVGADLQAHAAVGQVFQGFGDQAVEGLGAVAGQVPIQSLVDLADVGGAVDDLRAVGLGVDFRAVGQVLMVKVADDLFQNIFQGDDAQGFAVFVDDDADASFLFLEIDQLSRERRAFRDEVGFQAGAQQGLVSQLVMGQQAGDLAHMHHAFDLVDVVAIHRQAGVVGGAQLGGDLFEAVVEVDADHLVARDHDVVDRDVVQVKDAQQHVLPVEGQGVFGLAHHAAQLLGGQAVVALAGGVDAQQAQQAVADPAQQQDQWVEQLEQQGQGQAGRIGDGLGAQGGQGLGGDFAEDQ